MNKAEDRRVRILDNLADHVLAHGLIASSLRPLAKAAGTSDRMLLYYFKDKAEIVEAALQLVAARMVGLMAMRAPPRPLRYGALLNHFAKQLSDPLFWPYLRIWLEVASRAANGDALYRQTGEQIGRGFLAWCMTQLESDSPEWDAARLVVAIEGMVFLKSIGLDDVCAAALALPR